MNLVTLGPIGDGQTLDGISDETFKRYMHQYNMPPYSTGEAKPLRSAIEERLDMVHWPSGQSSHAALRGGVPLCNSCRI